MSRKCKLSFWDGRRGVFSHVTWLNPNRPEVLQGPCASLFAFLLRELLLQDLIRPCPLGRHEGSASILLAANYMFGLYLLFPCAFPTRRCTCRWGTGSVTASHLKGIDPTLFPSEKGLPSPTAEESREGRRVRSSDKKGSDSSGLL